MTSQDTATSFSGGDFRVGPGGLSSLAGRVPNEHTNHTGLRAVRGNAWPRQWAALTEHNQAAL